MAVVMIVADFDDFVKCFWPDFRETSCCRTLECLETKIMVFITIVYAWSDILPLGFVYRVQCSTVFRKAAMLPSSGKGKQLIWWTLIKICSHSLANLHLDQTLFVVCKSKMAVVSWIKRDRLDVTWFFISLFNAQHVSVNLTIALCLLNRASSW